MPFMAFGGLFEIIDRVQDIVTLIAVPIAVYLLYRIWQKLYK
jgi:hypothetical protein